MRRAVLLACLILIPGCGGSPTEPTTVGDVTLSGTASSILDFTNDERQSRGLPPLRANPRLVQAAQLQADQNAQFGRIDHVIPEAAYPRPEDRAAAAGYAWSALAENTAAGFPGPRSAINGWLDSPPHRENLLSGTYTEIGVGYAVNAAGRPYYVQVFGRPR